MKNINKYVKRAALVTSVFGTLLLSSCKSDFLETTPTTSVTEELAFSSAANVTAIINGMHRDLYVRQNASQGQTGQGAMMIMLDALGEDLVFPSTGNGWYVTTVRWQDQVNENGSNLFFPYQMYYALIRNANLVIEKAPTVPTANNDDIAALKVARGEAYAFRAFSYLMLVQIYGKRYVPGVNNNQDGVPLRLSATEEPLARSSVEQVYTQINKDLDDAYALLDGSSRPFKSHFDQKVVQGLRARVALNQGNYPVAIASAQAARAGFPLMDGVTYCLGFNKLAENSEWIWGATIVADQTDYFGNFGAYMSRNYASTNIRQAPKAVNSKLYSLFPNLAGGTTVTDVRKKVIDPTGQHSNLNGLTPLNLPSNYSKFNYTSQKFLSVSFSDSRVDIPYMRASEMYLIEAEALYRSGNEPQSKIVFTNYVKMRDSAYPVTPTTTGAAYLTELLNNRRLELWGEGFRFFDLKRTNSALDRTGANHSTVVDNNVMQVPSTDKRWEYLIPKSEINANPLIVQNPI